MLSEQTMTPEGFGASEPWWQASLSLLQAGGPVVVLLCLLSLLALSLVLVKLTQFYQLRLWQHQPAQQALELWQQGHRSDAEAMASKSVNPVSRLMATAMQGINQQVPASLLQEEVRRQGADTLFHLRRGFRPLEVIGSLAPLLGLLGTVFGMIVAFQQLEAAGNQVNPAVLSGGIWVALLTTAAGLSVAIPVVACLNYLERKVDALAHQMDNLVTQVFTASAWPDVASEPQQTLPRNAVVTPLAGKARTAGYVR